MSLLNRRDLREGIMMSMSFAVIVMNCLAKLIASVSSFSVMEGYKFWMSNIAKVC